MEMDKKTANKYEHHIRLVTNLMEAYANEMHLLYADAAKDGLDVKAVEKVATNRHNSKHYDLVRAIELNERQKS